MSAESDPALDTLLTPFDEGLLPWPTGGVLFLRARDGAALHSRARPGLVCEQSFKPDAEALQRAGFELLEPGEEGDPIRRYPLVLVLPPRQRDEARALLARALSMAAPGGRVVASVPNTEGSRSAEEDLRKLAGPVGNLSKRKCRVFW
ncbi:MAG: 16S rRNA methyltransferase, partial [Lysobacter sp.]|nr:16S rRNA methyltransferase [Lysobacter sp.]